MTADPTDLRLAVEGLKLNVEYLVEFGRAQARELGAAVSRLDRAEAEVRELRALLSERTAAEQPAG